MVCALLVSEHQSFQRCGAAALGCVHGQDAHATNQATDGGTGIPLYPAALAGPWPLVNGCLKVKEMWRGRPRPRNAGEAPALHDPLPTPPGTCFCIDWRITIVTLSDSARGGGTKGLLFFSTKEHI